MLATSIFFKKFNDPIEPIVKLGADDGQVTYRNADGATLYGLELEARKTLEFLAPAMKDFSMVSNLTLATSSIEVGEEEGLALTNHTRPLVNQAPYVFNFALDYTNESIGTTARLLYNLVGPTIIEVGTKSSANTAGLDGAYLHPRHLLDLDVPTGHHQAIRGQVLDQEPARFSLQSDPGLWAGDVERSIQAQTRAIRYHLAPLLRCLRRHDHAPLHRRRVALAERIVHVLIQSAFGACSS